MSDMLWWQNLPFFSIMLCMLSAVISAVLKPRAARSLCVTACALACAMSAVVFCELLATGSDFTYRMGHYPAPWGNELRAGKLEGLLSVGFSLVMLLSLAGGEKHVWLDVEESKVGLYYVMNALLLGALLALTYTNDLFTAYVFVEISTIAACGILMIRQIGRTTLAATRYMIMSLLGSGLFLIGIAMTYSMTGHLLMPNLRVAVNEAFASGRYAVPLLVVVSLMSIGLAIKSGLFPFHFWMPDTYGFTTPASGAILSGLVSKGYIVLAMKVFYRVIGFENAAASHIFDVLFAFGLTGIIVGSVSAIKENDIRRMVAYSSAAQIGYIYAGIGLGTTAGMVAAVFHVLSHMATKPLLFIAASGLSDVSGTSKEFHDLQGAGHRNRVAGAAFTLGALSMVGIPTLAGFVSKLLFGMASLESGGKALPTLIVLAVSTVLNAVYFLRTVIRIYRPSPEGSTERLRLREQKRFAVVMCAFMLLNLLLGLFSGPIADVIERGLESFA